jgi:UDP-glucose 4-epimerase
MKILVAGGAGYIGSHMCRLLARSGHECAVLDDLSTGHAEAARWGELVRTSLLDAPALTAALRRTQPDAVMHFAAKSIVGDSGRDPASYYANNVTGTMNLLNAMRECRIERLVFSSTAAVYGEPEQTPITETHPLRPLNVYGATKLAAERMIADYCSAYGLRAMALRYFNVAGAEAGDGIGESHTPETHLIPNLLRGAVSGEPVRVFGTDYPTRDGTCIRDYVHVTDLCRAHLQALEAMATRSGFDAVNLGTGSGYTVREVLAAAAHVTGGQIQVQETGRRVGDPAALVASNEKAAHVLGWQPEIRDIRAIIASAWDWHRNPLY